MCPGKGCQAFEGWPPTATQSAAFACCQCVHDAAKKLKAAVPDQAMAKAQKLELFCTTCYEMHAKNKVKGRAGCNIPYRESCAVAQDLLLNVFITSHVAGVLFGRSD